MTRTETEITLTEVLPRDPRVLQAMTERLTALHTRLGLWADDLRAATEQVLPEDEAAQINARGGAAQVAFLLAAGWSEQDLRRAFYNAYTDPFDFGASVLAVISGPEPTLPLQHVNVMVNAGPWLEQNGDTIRDLILNASGHTEQGSRGSGQNRRMLRLASPHREALFGTYAEIDPEVTQLALLTFPAVPWEVDIDAGDLLHFIRDQAGMPGQDGYAALAPLFATLDPDIVRHRSLVTRLERAGARTATTQE